jgi:formylglycine-generating enzyme required for sulfatase activity
LRPVNYVSWYDSLRFANWLHNGQTTGAQDATTTEDGAYTFSGATTVGARNLGALVWLPNENEWYKAAYYKGGGTNAGYWDYATEIDATPNNNAPANDTGNSANYYANSHYAVDAPYYATPVGAYALSDGPYDTFDQNGNVSEWDETAVETGRGLRGGSWSSTSAALAASLRSYAGPTSENYNMGFRVAAVPEPCTLGLLALGGLWALRRCRRGRERSGRAGIGRKCTGKCGAQIGRFS